ncbi:MAG: 16S rRNA (uracil(1498)-N(3))-methyltransferase [Devosia sp.]|uniref:16S rRNA (uracil(1498)-N(3))-methyltransferase n=1 Tax=Devosia sp. TaxID=1871048 RepID=UPI001ACE3924|nr:16S rRNA (uracil(1498)-N(3))-methyltransferase [Devosia sp.]MBN9316940.1 16S rRNA (uracil(1498)-N(3))-methyltransferase [Devosia sp.]
MPRSHKTLPRLFVEAPLAPGATLEMGREHTNYLLTVLRMKKADALVVFNGSDGAWMARIADDHRKGATLEVVVQTQHQTPKSDLWFGFAPLRTGRLDYLVQKATEMGAGVIQPVITRYTQVSRLKSDKLVANVIEAAEQCEVLSVPTVADEVALSDLLAHWQHEQGLRRLIFCDESAPSVSPLEQMRDLDGLPVGLIVGPEGGFSDDERELLLAQPFVVPISLGPRILRADTAAVAALAVVQAIIGDWR